MKRIQSYWRGAEMELLDIVDEKGNPTGETVPREVAHREGIRHRTAHVWIFSQTRRRSADPFCRNGATIRIQIRAVMTFQVPVIFLQGVIIFLPRCGS